MKIKTGCHHCGSLSHKSFNCFNKPRKPLKQKRMKKIGPVTKKWLDLRTQWIKDNPGPWHCYICGKNLPTYLELTLDHIKSRTRHPELRFDLSNLAPCCYVCNGIKGSRDLGEVTR